MTALKAAMLSFCIAFAISLASMASAFQLYPFIAPEAMTQILGVSSGCISALNTTLPCDNDLFGWTQKVDQVYWEGADVATICTPSCISSAADWKLQVESACMDDYLRSGERYVPADTLSGRFVEGLNMACIKSSSNEWCLPASYDWVGSDVVQVDCDMFPTDPWCLNRADPSSDNSRISALYDDDLLCSECFLKILHARVTSDFLPDTDFSDYLVNEFQDVQNVCQTTVGELVTRIVPGYPHITDGGELGIPTTSPTTTSDPIPTSTVCAGRMIDIRPDREEGLTCHDIAEKYELASGEFAIATKSEYCDATGPICVPNTCNLYLVDMDDTCESIAKTLSNTTTEVSVAQLATWNPYILGACDHLAAGQYICSGPPGGAWISPPGSEIPDSGDGPVRGGPGSTASLPIVEDPNAVPADRVQEGIPSDCSRWVVANSTTASCWKVANDGKISQQRLFDLNPVLGENGANCATQVWLGYYYCVATKGDGSGPGPTPTTTSSPTPTGTPKPTNTQAGIDPNCNRFVVAKSGDSCSSLASGAGIELAQFYKWNTVLGENGEDCNTQVWADYYYCVGVSTTTTTPPPTTTTDAPLPTQTQEGFPSSCKKYVQAKAGASCLALATENGIDVAQLYELNPVLGPNGEDCATQVWVDYYYCLAI
ncbi:LysM domain-containing protein [Astrocystis sublimbata]|nr:LysM domain-containing protein [Astrocystis sublimbata]